MCLGIYIASDEPLPLVEWNPAAPSFSVTPLFDYEAPVREQFTRPNIVYAGSHSQCGCGFTDAPDEEPEAVARSRASLVAYLTAAAARSGIEVFACWDGEYSESPSAVTTRSAPDLALSYEWLDERAFTRIPQFAA